MTITLRVRKASFVMQCIWWYDTDQNERSPDHICGFVLFTYVFWCAVCGMLGVLLPATEATEVEDGSFQAEIVLQRSCRNLWKKGREKTRLWVRFLQKQKQHNVWGQHVGVSMDTHQYPSFIPLFIEEQQSKKLAVSSWYEGVSDLFSWEYLPPHPTSNIHLFVTKRLKHRTSKFWLQLEWSPGAECSYIVKNKSPVQGQLGLVSQAFSWLYLLISF